ncbi:META domain-containing protein [Leucobacter sp. UT-8R-CII-1-4]|uniref:META domain-containing protein n=1 Tax=Leucobacter sp. UT-8R-CII-1-4 TaxID=3040075 RepID=UPI0024A80810|nr:META domain-containing protein [Leucobacter sp. UT-8R-CII-1-4]MDI6021929.1 META domain-containing protein [Leucobacter sp. UT-8R-CII-1-4]
MNLKTRITIATASVALATLGLAACSSTNNNDASTVNSGETNQATRDNVVGKWGDPKSTDKPSLEFTADGTLSGSDGCNRITGTWTAEGEVVVFGPMASTKMACEGVETWLIDPASATVKGDVLTVSDSKGKEIGTLDRA